jgi:hypothetical protein
VSHFGFCQFAFWCVGISISTGLYPISADEISDRANQVLRPSTLELLVSGFLPNGDAKRETEVGSAFIAHSDSELKETYLFTAGHVIGKRESWLELDDRKLGRTILVRRQKDNDTMESLAENAKVITEWGDVDFAILAIPQQSTLTALALVTSGHVQVGDLVAVAGFPANQRFSVRVIRVDHPKRTDLKLELDGTAKQGQSGGPVMDERGRVIAIVGENDDKLRPQSHRATIISVAVQSLNKYLKARGRPELSLEDLTLASGKISTVERTGRAAVSLRGSLGELAKRPSRQQTLPSVEEAKLEANGSEISECNEEFGRAQSIARAIAAIRPFESTGIKFSFDLFAAGGHYRKALTCISGAPGLPVPIGLTEVDTEAAAAFEASANLKFTALVTPFELRITWQDMPKNTQLELLRPDTVVEYVSSAEGNSEKTITVHTTGVWRLSVSTSVETSAKGALRHHMSRQALVFLEAH